MAIELYNDGKHVCLMFTDLVDDEADHAIQANQFLIVDNGHGCLIDPGGNMTYNALRMAMYEHFQASELDYVFASHADPDIVASVNKWLVHTDCKVAVSKIWSRFIPHFCTIGSTEGRIIPIPDPGMHFKLGASRIVAVPAHFLHSEGNFQFYDSVSKILFTGDMGASLVAHEDAGKPIESLEKHVPYMKPFHQRYMCSQKIVRYWADMVRRLDVEWLVPQHGSPIKGQKMIEEYLNWVVEIPCGVDIMTQNNYQLPLK
ncbi:MBL fold metallo-hydrolase [Leeia sp. TBRC 13508]|uniref:MBL fold metallo-hydrolase n=1 Tax=Leeia speluncae TaxID=2884804 RepID=A0ABS8D718_9NEIS|nr:MBL fold metallo-hydrolase [Leeia speluncae]MCB6183776.1 MBL fold metallo-hydrolase [Leeia speluncae]